MCPMVPYISAMSQGFFASPFASIVRQDPLLIMAGSTLASHLGIYPWRQGGTKTHGWRNLVISFIQVISRLHSLGIGCSSRRWCSRRSSSGALSLWKRVNPDSSDHMTFFHCSRVQFLCSLLNRSRFPQLASMISGFLKAKQLFSPNLLSSRCIVQVDLL